MNGMLATDYPLKRSAQAITMISKSSVKIAALSPVIIPNSKNYFSTTELCTYPTARFNSPFMLRQPQKPALADALWTKLTPETKTQPKGMYSTRWTEVLFSIESHSQKVLRLTKCCATCIALTCKGKTEEQ